MDCCHLSRSPCINWCTINAAVGLARRERRRWYSSSICLMYKILRTSRRRNRVHLPWKCGCFCRGTCCWSHSICYANASCSGSVGDELLKTWREYHYNTVQYIILYAAEQWQSDDLMQNRRNSIANALELRLFCIKTSKYRTSDLSRAYPGLNGFFQPKRCINFA